MYIDKGQGQVKAARSQDAMHGRLQQKHTVNCSKMTSAGKTVIHL